MRFLIAALAALAFGTSVLAKAEPTDRLVEAWIAHSPHADRLVEACNWLVIAESGVIPRNRMTGLREAGWHYCAVTAPALARAVCGKAYDAYEIGVALPAHWAAGMDDKAVVKAALCP